MLKEHVVIRGWTDMTVLGINLLTGERDRTGTRRMLCDLSLKGARLIKEYLSLTIGPAGSLPFQSNWNRRVNGDEAVYSVMLHADWWPELAVFGLIVEEQPFVYRNKEVVWSDDGDTWNEVEAAWQAAYAKGTDPETKEVDHQKVMRYVPEYLREISKWKPEKGSWVNNEHQISGRK